MDTTQETLQAPIRETALELVDCGEASKVTRGSIWGFIYEFAPPPFDKQLIL